MNVDSRQSFVTMTSILGGLVGGLVHVSVAVFLWNYWFDNIWAMLTYKPLNGVYLILGMFFLGFVPCLFYIQAKVISPTIVVAVLLLLSGFASWLASPVRAPSAVPTPFALYILFWVVVVVVAGLTGRFEYQRRQGTTG